MRTLILVIVSLLRLSTAYAGDDWLCTQEASIQTGNVIHACGLGYGQNEQEARADSFEQAKKEFMRICSESQECRTHKTNVTPGRMTCARNKVYTNTIQCYRVVFFEITSERET